MDNERINIGRAIAMGATGGAKPDSALLALVAAIRDMQLAAAKGASYEWPDAALIALADVDAMLDRRATLASSLAICKGEKASLAAILAARDGNAIRSNSAWRAMATAAVAARDEWHAEAAAATEGEHKANERANAMETRYRAESLRCNELSRDLTRIIGERDALQDRNDNQAMTIRTYESQNAAAVKAAESIVAELDEARASLAEWHGRAEKAESQLAEYRSLMAALPAGMALRYPAALPLLRAYLSDTESE